MMRRWLAVIFVVTARSVMYSMSLIFFLAISCSMEFQLRVGSQFSFFHEDVPLDASPKFLTWLVSKSRSIKLHPISIIQVHVSFLRFAHLSSLISFFCSTIKVMYFSSVFRNFFVFLFCFAASQTFATACCFASAVFFAAVDFNFFSAAAVLVIFSFASLTDECLFSSLSTRSLKCLPI